MGQLEKYGLYVLCLVIFLILGVTIWGGGDAPPPRSTAAIHAPNGPAAPPATGGSSTNTTNVAATPKSIDELFPSDPRIDSGAGGAREASSGRQEPLAGGDPTKAPTTGGETKDPAPKPETRVVAYKVQDGDTYESLARTKLGKASLWTEIQRLNPAIKPEKLRPGQEIQMPTTASLAAAAPVRDGAASKPIAVPPDGNRTYTVRKGDNFERIAKAELGNSRRFLELVELNPDVKPEKLRPGMSIKLPKK
jgi:nucleoid-associated protein YgaU